jgi:RHH-type proline utilization regulon transcriptional repressor/proline dehydrogenase/delta 1-pyrroline-5-carboxylate dehydrogenase
MQAPDSYARTLTDFRPDPATGLPDVIQKAVFIAARLQERAAELQTSAERRQQAELDRMLRHPQDKATLAQITDQAFRSNTSHRAVDQFIHILDVQGIPRFFSPFKRTLLKGFQSFGGYAPGVAVPLVKDQMRKETANVILPAEPELLLQHLRERHAEGVRMNVNFLGEAILGEDEAYQRLQTNLQALQSPDIEVISIKISTLYSQISPLAREQTVATLCERLELLYRTAARQMFTRLDGRTLPKFVYLDMEEYRDLSLTAEAFMRTLERPGLEKAAAGIVLQAYIPDSFRYQQEINAWARKRAAVGGAPITLRVVKGANMEMERFEAAQRGWPQAAYKTKLETDANYKRMVNEAMKPENIAAVNLGVASHNLFDISYALVLAAEKGLLDKVQFEMLEGMANAQRRAFFELTHNVLLYAPVCRKQDFIHAIGYLVRRLDENTGPENFLRHAFRIQPGSPDWQRLAQGFVAACKATETVSDAPRRTQNRLLPLLPVDAVAQGWQHLVNEPDTDFSLPHNCAWAKQIIAAWQPRCGEKALEIPLVVAGEEVFDEAWHVPELAKGVSDAGNHALRSKLRDVPPEVRECFDPSRPGVVVGRYRQASAEDVGRAVACAAADEDGWRTMTPQARFERLGHVAEEFRKARGDLIGAALADGGKTISESDPEISEAVDFVEFYRANARWWQEHPALRARPKGVVVVVSPWNFPIAIPTGGVAAALAAGNTVILKPASDSVLPAWELCQCFWRGGVSRKTLQFLPCAGNKAGRQLVNHDGVNAVVLTGGTETALNMLRDKPSLHLLAETGGKNATIVTAMADRDQAIKHVVHSAFSHAGQKCSATSLLLLEAEVYDDPKFKHSLCDAVNSLCVGPAWNLETKMGPLIRPPSGDLENALKVLEPGESWAVLPRRLENNPNLWSPGVKYDVEPGSYTHMTEFFGPVLGVMRFEKLVEAIEMVNQTGFGLTSGLQSLDDREQQQWQEQIRAGNLYINRTTVGAIVLRQPFGGMGKSVFGPGMKAGGPNYTALLMDFEDVGLPSADKSPEDPILRQLGQLFEHLTIENLKQQSEPWATLELSDAIRAAVNYTNRFCEEFGQSHDHFKLIGQDNFRRYLPVRELRIRVEPHDSLLSIIARLCAARVARCRTTISAPRDCRRAALRRLEEYTEPWAGAVEFVEETDAELAAVVRGRQTDRIRYAAPDRVTPAVQQAAAETGIYLATEPVSLEGRRELLWYVQEQSISADYHRYGNLGVRDGEPRAAVL